MISVSLSFFFGSFLIGHHVSQGTISYLPRQQSLRAERASRGSLVHTASHVDICPLSTPDRWPSRLCTNAFVFGELLPPAHNQPSLTNHVLHLIVGETACSPFCCWLSVPSPLWLGLPNTWVSAAGTRAIFFLPGAISSPFPPLGRVQGSHL